MLLVVTVHLFLSPLKMGLFFAALFALAHRMFVPRLERHPLLIAWFEIGGIMNLSLLMRARLLSSVFLHRRRHRQPMPLLLWLLQIPPQLVLLSMVLLLRHLLSLMV